MAVQSIAPAAPLDHAALDSTYELLLSMDVADEISSSELGEGNRTAAESIASIAAGLVPLR
jgi:hypothetical protein